MTKPLGDEISRVAKEFAGGVEQSAHGRSNFDQCDNGALRQVSHLSHGDATARHCDRGGHISGDENVIAALHKSPAQRCAEFWAHAWPSQEGAKAPAGRTLRGLSIKTSSHPGTGAGVFGQCLLKNCGIRCNAPTILATEAAHAARPAIARQPAATLHSLATMGAMRALGYIGSSTLELGFPRRDLIGVDVELLRQLSQCSVALDGGKRHLRLEARCVVPARSSAHGFS
jgi:hypothetical protein